MSAFGERTFAVALRDSAALEPWSLRSNGPQFTRIDRQLSEALAGRRENRISYGETAAVPGSPIPPGASVLLIMCTSTKGTSLIRSMR